jgi:uncharacterized phage infection (PIP) family protein YhgE
MQITWDISVSVPQLDTLNTLMEILVDTTQAIKDEMARLNDGLVRLADTQVQQTTALATELDQIQAEIAQFTEEDITQDQLNNLLASVTDAANKAHAAADTAAQQLTTIQSNTEAITGIVPDAPPA